MPNKTGQNKAYIHQEYILKSEAEKIGWRSCYRVGYRADIEGLRAVAILMVIAAHAKVPWLAGGFVGVDVFFVISGYLITGLLVREIQRTNSVLLTEFYARRMRRLLPSLLLMLAIVSVLGWQLLPPSAQSEQAIAAISAFAWMSNFHFALMNVDYFSAGSESNLFLHTWSLSVEEQFYLVWPMLMMMAMAPWSKIKFATGNNRPIWTLLAMSIFALALSMYWTEKHTELGFYMMPSRMWQFAAGGISVLISMAPTTEQTKYAAKKIHFFAPTLGLLGLTTIVITALVLNDQVPYPGILAIFPTIGSALVLIFSDNQEKWGASRLLASPPLPAIGQVSYAWYLWHWPTLLFGNELIDTRNPWNRLILAALSLGIATLSYRYFERPLRLNAAIANRPKTTVFTGCILMLLTSMACFHWLKIAELRMRSDGLAPYLRAKMNAPTIYSMGCDDWYHSSDVHLCSFGAQDAQHTAVAIGDSIGLQWFPAFNQIFNRPGWRLLVLTKSACPMIDEPIFYTLIGRTYTECAIWRKAAIQTVKALHPDVVMLGSSSAYRYTQPQWEYGTQRILEQLSPATQKIYIMRPTPTLSFNGPNCLMPRGYLYERLLSKPKCVSPAESSLNSDVSRRLAAAASRFSNVHMIDMADAVCPLNQCKAQIDGTITFADEQHLTSDYAKSLAPILYKRFGFEAHLFPPDMPGEVQ